MSSVDVLVLQLKKMTKRGKRSFEQRIVHGIPRSQKTVDIVYNPFVKIHGPGHPLLRKFSPSALVAEG